MTKHDLVCRFYKGVNAEQYDERRSINPKWRFEENVFLKIYSRVECNIESVIDAPVGTGRFLNSYINKILPEKVTALDLSDDMLYIAKSRSANKNILFDRADIVNSPIKNSADLVVCFRFLNLVQEKDALKSLNNLLEAANKYLLVSVRLVEDKALRDHIIEDKIILQYKPLILNACSSKGFKVMDVRKYIDHRPGEYCILLLGR